MTTAQTHQPVAYQIEDANGEFMCLSRTKSTIRGIASKPLYAESALEKERTSRIEAHQRLADMQELAAKAGLSHMKTVQEAVAEAVAAEREMTETQRAAMQAAHDAIALAQNNLAASRESAIAFDDGDLWDQYQRAMDGITAALAEPEPADAPAGYTTSPITWKSPRHHSEQIVKITQRQQPEYGFTHAVFNAPQRREPLTDAEWLDYVLRHGTKTDVHIATYEGIATVGPMGKVIRLQTDANNLRKLVEKAHGIGAKP